MNVSETGYQIDLKPLVNLTSRLNGADGHHAVRIRGMFFRVQDFESSASRLIRQLYKEGFAAIKYLGKYDEPEFSNKMENEEVRLHMHTNTGFDTYDLSPMLRHFLNDACRTLEPMVGLLQRKYPDMPARVRDNRFVSFNEYLKRLERANVNTNLDNDFFLALYEELWNDYKHAESRGIHAGSWHLRDDGTIAEPILIGERLNYFKDTTVEDFFVKTLKNIDEVLEITKNISYEQER